MLKITGIRLAVFSLIALVLNRPALATQVAQSTVVVSAISESHSENDLVLKSESNAPALSFLPKEIGFGFNSYSELLNGQTFMQLQGPDIAFRWYPKLKNNGADAWWWLMEYRLGLMNYRSDYSGSMDNKLDANGKWQLGYQFHFGDRNNIKLKPAFSLEGTWSDLNGKTSLNQVGYLRTNTSLWASIGLGFANSSHSDAMLAWDDMQFEAGALLKGQQKSYLSQASPALSDATNIQSKGYYLQYSISLLMNKKFSLRPYIRYTHVSDSDLILNNGFPVMEPENTRTQIGLFVGF